MNWWGTAFVQLAGVAAGPHFYPAHNDRRNRHERKKFRIHAGRNISVCRLCGRLVYLSLRAVVKVQKTW